MPLPQLQLGLTPPVAAAASAAIVTPGRGLQLTPLPSDGEAYEALAMWLVDGWRDRQSGQGGTGVPEATPVLATPRCDAAEPQPPPSQRCRGNDGLGMQTSGGPLPAAAADGVDIGFTLRTNF